MFSKFWNAEKKELLDLKQKLEDETEEEREVMEVITQTCSKYVEKKFGVVTMTVSYKDDLFKWAEISIGANPDVDGAGPSMIYYNGIPNKLRFSNAQDWQDFLAVLAEMLKEQEE